MVAGPGARGSASLRQQVSWSWSRLTSGLTSPAPVLMLQVWTSRLEALQSTSVTGSMTLAFTTTSPVKVNLARSGLSFIT